MVEAGEEARRGLPPALFDLVARQPAGLDDRGFLPGGGLEAVEEAVEVRRGGRVHREPVVLLCPLPACPAAQQPPQ
jgi:hypothetical protein